MTKQWIDAGRTMFLAAILFCFATGMPASAAEMGSPASQADAAAQIAHGKILFISYGCGYCHEDAGRKVGKCPQLMDTQRDDNFILTRIAAGSSGKMPAFGEALTGDDINALLLYIRSLKPESKP